MRRDGKSARMTTVMYKSRVGGEDMARDSKSPEAEEGTWAGGEGDGVGVRAGSDHTGPCGLFKIGSLSLEPWIHRRILTRGIILSDLYFIQLSLDF